MERVVVVGGGLAGLGSVRALRDEGYRGRITLLGAEPHLPYDRPPLSKELLAGKVDDSTLEADWDELDIERVLGCRAIGLRTDPDNAAVRTDYGDFPHDGLIVATGAAPVRMPGEGPQWTLRTVDDARALRERLRPDARIVIIGAGWIGAEVATAAADAGCRVTVLEAGQAPLEASVGAEVGRHTSAWYEAAGVDVRCNTPVTRVVAGGVELGDGEVVPADEVLTAVGVRPDVDWLAGSGIVSDGVIPVDAWLRTSLPGVCAVGDCTAWWSTRFGARLRVEHWDNALRAPTIAARTLLRSTGEAGLVEEEIYDPVPYFWSAQHGRMMQYAGYHGDSDRLVRRGDPDGEHWTVCWLRRGCLVAILTVNRPRDLTQGRKAIRRGTPMRVDALADPEVPLKQAVA